MGTLALVGLSVMFTPALVYLMECGLKGDAGDFPLWLMSKTPEQIYLLAGCATAGTALVAAALMQRVWVL